MKRSRKSGRVSWAPALNLCQVRLFLSEIALQKSVDMVQWKCPPNFVVNYDWRVTVGEESQESQAQKLREMRVLEAVYPRPSSVPPNIEEEIYDDSLTPIIPLIPVEEEEAAEIQLL
ncbi:zinc finger CCCH domain-containing protein [Salix suchowensis]|nr:zinc finger CCCH domain-containing protein [Salix suchowensis]